MKIIKNKTTETESLEELFGRKKKAAEPAPIPEKPAINMEWKKYYEMLEAIRKSGVSAWLAGGYFVADSGLPEELARKIWFSWIENYDQLADKFNWQKED